MALLEAQYIQSLGRPCERQGRPGHVITGTETPSALRPCLSSMPDPSFRLMSIMTQTAFSDTVWFLKASADENRMGRYACARSRRSGPSNIPESSSTTKTRLRSWQSMALPPVRQSDLRSLEKLKSKRQRLRSARTHTALREPEFSAFFTRCGDRHSRRSARAPLQEGHRISYCWIS